MSLFLFQDKKDFKRIQLDAVEELKTKFIQKATKIFHETIIETNSLKLEGTVFVTLNDVQIILVQIQHVSYIFIRNDKNFIFGFDRLFSYFVTKAKK